MTLAGADRSQPDSAGNRLGPEQKRSWTDRLYAWRDRILANPRFQRFAAGFPLTRPVAHGHASALFDICAGFVYSQVLAACIRLGVFDLLREKPRTAEDLARRFDMPEEGARRLLDAAVSLRLLSWRSGGRYGLGMLGAALAGNPGVAAMVNHHAMLYDDLRDPLALLRGEIGETRLSRYWPYAEAGATHGFEERDVAGYTALMSASQGLIAEDILGAYDFRRHGHMLDIGGGDGTFILAAASHAPSLRLTLFDLPPVAEMAQTRFNRQGLGARASAVGGSFLRDPLPEGADLVTLIRILLDHDDETALTILRAVRRAISPGGVLVIAEPVSGLTGSPRVSEAYFGLYLFAMGRGRARTVPELSGLLDRAGFHRIEVRKTRRPLLTNMLIARPKSDRM